MCARFGRRAFVLVLPLLMGALLLICVRPASGQPMDPPAAAPATTQAPASAATTVTMVLVPSGDVQAATQAAQDLAALLATETGHPVEVLTSDCYARAVDAMGAGQVDLGWLPAVTYVMANAQIGAEARLVTERHGSTQYRGQFLVRSDSGMDQLADLAGRNFAFGDPGSSSSFVYPALHISNTQGMTYGVFFSQTVFAGWHGTVVRAVYEGLYDSTPIDGGATYEDARTILEDEYPDIYTETKVITYTPWIPNDAVAVRPGLDPEVAQNVISGLLTIADTPAGQDALGRMLSIEDLQPVDDSAYDIVRQAVDAYGIEFGLCPEEVSMVVVALGDPEAAAGAVEEVASLLEDETGHYINAYIAGCLGAGVDAMATGEADVGWLPAMTYALANTRIGVDARLVVQRNGSTQFRGQFLVRSDSGIDALADLAGKNFAFGDPTSASSHMYPAVHISHTQGVTYGVFFSETVFAGSHTAVAQAVYEGNHEGTPVHGGVTYEDVRESMLDDFPDIFTETKVITYTVWIPNDLVSVRQGMDPQVSQDVIDGLLAIADTPEGLDALNRMMGIDGFQPVDDSAYDIVRDTVAAYEVEYETCSEVALAGEGVDGNIVYTGTGAYSSTLSVPGGAVSEATTLSFTPLPVVTFPPETAIATGIAFELRGVVSGTQELVTVLQGTYTLTVSYDEGALGDVAEASLQLYYWTGQQWVAEPACAVDTVLNVVTCNPDHFSRWAAFGQRHIYLPVVLRGL